jgi:hypothetical protein
VQYGGVVRRIWRVYGTTPPYLRQTLAMDLSLDSIMKKRCVDYRIYCDLRERCSEQIVYKALPERFSK